MSTLAQILHDLGNEVIGYDDVTDYKFTEDNLIKRNIKIYSDDSLKLNDDIILTYSAAFSLDHKEIIRAKNSGIKIQKYNEIIAEVIDLFSSIGVSGTHGKTTTSSMIKHILENEIGCNYFVGAGEGKVNKENKYFVVESDEFNRHFTLYKPAYSVITNIEEEHMEIYKDIEDIKSAFEIFANNTSELVVACGDNLNVRNLNYQKPVKFYGFNEDNTVVIKNVKLTETGSNFDLYEDNKLIGNFDLPMFGKHMVLNSVAAIIITSMLGISVDKIKKHLNSFENATRRFAEIKMNDIIIIDDYAHHPTEIKVTLEAVRQKYPTKKLVAVFKPNTYSRTKDFKEDFISSLSIADKVYLTPIDSNREKSENYPGISSFNIINGIDNAELIDLDTINKLEIYKDSVICFMSCAYVDKLIKKYQELIRN